jgi:cell fate regulator YaaT (PSP1 superfamily)
MALYVAVKFSQEEMPKLYDPGPLQDLQVQDFIVVPRAGTEDVGFVACLEHKSIHQLKLRREPYPRVARKATPDEVEAWWRRKALEREAMIVCKQKSQELHLDIKISHVRYEMGEPKAVFQFTSEQRVDFRQLVKDLSAILKVRIELWQMGIRDEARFVDGFGVCGLQTCCSTWLTEFRPITIKMAKDQDITLPPAKLSGQCGRLLCCLSYEVDQYRQMSRESLPKGATVTWEGKEMIIIDRNLIGRTYLITDHQGTYKTVKAEELAGSDVKVPAQMKSVGKRMGKPGDRRPSASDEQVERPTDSSSGEVPFVEVVVATTKPVIPLETVEPEGADGEMEGPEGSEERGSRRGRRGRRRGPKNRGDAPAGDRPTGERPASAEPPPAPPAADKPRRSEPRERQRPRPPAGELPPTAPPTEAGGEPPADGAPAKRNSRNRKRHRNR